MKFEIMPVNKRLLLEKVVFEQENENEEKPKFYFAEDELVNSEVEYFKVLQYSDDISIKVYVGDIVTVEFCQPIGNINGKELFIAAESAITARIFELKEEDTPF